jgi:hypothetical protein
MSNFFTLIGFNITGLRRMKIERINNVAMRPMFLSLIRQRAVDWGKNMNPGMFVTLVAAFAMGFAGPPPTCAALQFVVRVVNPDSVCYTRSGVSPAE